MTTTVPVTDFRNNISDYLNRIIYKKESFVIKRGNTPVAKVVACDIPEKQVKNLKTFSEELAKLGKTIDWKAYDRYKKTTQETDAAYWKKFRRRYDLD